MSWAALLLAAALLIGADSRPRVRAGLTAVEPQRRSTPSGPSDPLAAASSFDVLAACLRSGMAVSTAASATAPSAPATLARVLNRAADLLALGAEPATAWTNLPSPQLRPVPSLRGGPRWPGRQPRRRAVAPGPSIGVVGRCTGARSFGASRSVPPRGSRCGERCRRAGLGVDRWAAGPLLSAGVRVSRHSPRGRRVGR